MPGHGGRKPNPEMSKTWKVHVNATTAGRVEARLMDHSKGKPKYGSRGELINGLLERWLLEESNYPESRLIPSSPETTNA